MADVMQQIGDYAQGASFGISSNMIMILIIVSIVGIIFLITAFFGWRSSFNEKVRIYRPYGHYDIETLKNIYESKTTEERNAALKKHSIKYESVGYKKTLGKFIKRKGISYFALFSPMVKIEPIPNEFKYDDGFHLLQLASGIFIPIHKPQTIIEVGANISLSILEENAWRQWNVSESLEIDKRFKEESRERKIILMFIIGIVAIIIIGGLLFWLQYMMMSKGMFTLGSQLESFRKATTSAVTGGFVPA